MFYHLDTIPVWDAVKQDSACPICYLRNSIEEKDVERFLGGSVMEPDVRIRVNALGFCPHHHRMLYALQNRLGHALLMQTRLQTVRSDVMQILENAANGVKPKLFKGDKSGILSASADQIEKQMNGCIICDSISENIARYGKTLMHLYKTDESFRKAFAASKGFCMHDLPLILRLADENLSGDTLKDFLQTLYGIQKRELDQLQSDVDGFCVKFDYRNKDKPWGTSKGSLERSVNKLRGYTFEEK